MSTPLEEAKGLLGGAEATVTGLGKLVSALAAPAPTPTPTPTSSMIVGLDIGGWEWNQEVVNNEAGCLPYVRSSYKHFNSDAAMDLLRNAGLTLLPLFGEGGSLAGYNTSAFQAEIVTWFKRYGKGGTYWQGKSVDLGATTCELINEPGNPYFYPDYANHSLYAGITKAVKAALATLTVKPILLVSYDGGYNGSEYGRAIFAAGAVADAVTVHPYGGHGSVTSSAEGNRARVTQAHAETGLPVYVTEVGWPTAVGQPATGDSLQWSEEQQKNNAVSFIKWCRGLGYVGGVVYFNYADYGTNNWYGVVDHEGKRRKPIYAALKAA